MIVSRREGDMLGFGVIYIHLFLKENIYAAQRVNRLFKSLKIKLHVIIDRQMKLSENVVRTKVLREDRR